MSLSNNDDNLNHENSDKLKYSFIQDDTIQPKNRDGIYDILLSDESLKKYNATKEKPQKNNNKIIIISVIVIAIIIIIALANNTDSDLTPIDEPQSGAILMGAENYYGSTITIRASGGESCVVKLKSPNGVTRISFYVRAGDTVTIGVPAEYLYAYFASGDTWYGVDQLFGERTSYSMDDQILNFVNYSWEYTLYPVSSGNFSQTPINANEFR